MITLSRDLCSRGTVGRVDVVDTVLARLLALAEEVDHVYPSKTECQTGETDKDSHPRETADETCGNGKRASDRQGYVLLDQRQYAVLVVLLDLTELSAEDGIA